MVFLVNNLPLSTIASANPFYAFSQSDILGQSIILLLLFGSIYIWTVMIDKWSYLSKNLKSAKKFKTIFRESRGTLSVYKKGIKEENPLTEVYRKGAEELLSYYKISDSEPHKSPPKSHYDYKLTTAQIETVRSIMEQTVSDKILELEEKMGFLATAVSVSPFFGLLGTVWGVMMAFISIALQGKAQISAMAPGVSGALLTTVVALLVAIPSLIGYNFLSNYIRQLTVYMDNFVEEFMAKIKLEQIDE